MNAKRPNRMGPSVIAFASFGALLAWNPCASADGLLCQAHKTIGLLELPRAPSFDSYENDILIVDDVVFIASGRAGMFAVDVSDPTSPALLHDGAVLGLAEYIDVEGATLYASTLETLLVFDVADPRNPHLLFTIDGAEQFGALEAVGDRLYVAEHRHGLTVFDVSDPSAPVRLGTTVGDFFMTDLAVVGDIVYGVDRSGQFDVFDVADPAAPTLLARLPISETLTSLSVADDLAYVTTETRVMVIVDVSNPSAPTQLERRPGVDAEAMCIVGDRAYLAGRRLTALDMHDPLAPEPIGSIELIGSRGVAIAVRDGLACVVDLQYGLCVVDVSGSLEPAEIGHAAGSFGAESLDIDGPFAVARVYGMEIYDVSDPTAPRFLRRYPQGVGPYDRFRISGRMIYHVGVDVLRVFELSDAGVPALRGQVSVPGSPGVLDLHGTLLFVATGADGLAVIDVSEPDAPRVIGQYLGADSIIDVRVQGNHAFVIENGVGMRVLDVTDPTAPIAIGGYADAEARSVDVNGSIACLAIGQAGVIVLDVADPLHPFAVGVFDSPMWLTKVRISGGYAFAGATYGGNFQIIDISEPSSPLLAGWMCVLGDTPVRRGDLVYSGDWRLNVARFSDCPSCEPDLNTDGLLDVADVQTFLDLYAAGDDRADFVDDGRLDFFDVQRFLGLYSTGCG